MVWFGLVIYDMCLFGDFFPTISILWGSHLHMEFNIGWSQVYICLHITPESVSSNERMDEWMKSHHFLTKLRRLPCLRAELPFCRLVLVMDF